MPTDPSCAANRRRLASLTGCSAAAVPLCQTLLARYARSAMLSGICGCPWTVPMSDKCNPLCSTARCWWALHLALLSIGASKELRAGVWLRPSS